MLKSIVTAALVVCATQAAQAQAQPAPATPPQIAAAPPEMTADQARALIRAFADRARGAEERETAASARAYLAEQEVAKLRADVARLTAPSTPAAPAP